MQRRRNARRPDPHADLFGEIPVTFDELAAWCEAVPRISRSSSRFTWYCNGWRVADKVRAAKVAGTFDAIVGAPAIAQPAWYTEIERRMWRRELELT